MRAKFALGDEVRVIRAIRNDGTMYGYATGWCGAAVPASYADVAPS